MTDDSGSRSPDKRSRKDQLCSLLLINESLNKLAQRDANASEIVKLRFFGGLTLEEAGQLLGFTERTALVLVGVTVLLILPARATQSVGVSQVTIAHGSFDEIDIFAKTDIDPSNPTDYWKAMINTKGATHLYVVQNTVLPDGSFGWHHHTGPSLIIVMSGTATEYEGNDPTCTPRVHPAGTTFVDSGQGSGHLVRNDGNVNLVVTVVRFVPEGAVQRLDLDNPGYCPDLN